MLKVTFKKKKIVKPVESKMFNCTSSELEYSLIEPSPELCGANSSDLGY